MRARSPLTFAFWNLNRNEFITHLVSDLVLLNRVDVLLLAECAIDPAALCKRFQLATGITFHTHAGRINNRVIAFTRFPTQCGDALAESHYMTVWPLIIPGSDELLLAGMHGISRLEAEQIDLDTEATIAAQLVRDTEDKRGHRRTVLLGDFNLNPFDHGMATARGFHGVMSRQIALRQERRVKYQRYPMFYNPMWSKLGDRSDSPPGTYYYDKSSHLLYYWHVYDQVLLRPELLKTFDPQNVRIIDAIGQTSLIADNVPDCETASDHLPVLMRLRL